MRTGLSSTSPLGVARSFTAYLYMNIVRTTSLQSFIGNRADDRTTHTHVGLPPSWLLLFEWLHTRSHLTHTAWRHAALNNNDHTPHPPFFTASHPCPARPHIVLSHHLVASTLGCFLQAGPCTARCIAGSAHPMQLPELTQARRRLKVLADATTSKLTCTRSWCRRPACR